MISESNEANFGQTEIIFRKNLFSVTAKRVGFTEYDFRKRFSANSNTALLTTILRDKL